MAARLAPREHGPIQQAEHAMNDDAKWQAVQDRDPAMDGAFVYGVLTTGIYCRPSCAAAIGFRRLCRWPASMRA